MTQSPEFAAGQGSKGLEMIAFDPTTLLTTSADAVTTAGVLLHVPRAGLDCDSVWTAAAELPLAALLYAGSACGNGKGIGWVVRAVDNPHQVDGYPDEVGWLSAARDLAAQPLFGDALRRTLDMNPRQRDSLLMTLRDAVSPWKRPAKESTGE
jgi:hypothetical protein